MLSELSDPNTKKLKTSSEFSIKVKLPHEQKILAKLLMTDNEGDADFFTLEDSNVEYSFTYPEENNLQHIQNGLAKIEVKKVEEQEKLDFSFVKVRYNLDPKYDFYFPP